MDSVGAVVGAVDGFNRGDRRRVGCCIGCSARNGVLLRVIRLCLLGAFCNVRGAVGLDERDGSTLGPGAGPGSTLGADASFGSTLGAACLVIL